MALVDMTMSSVDRFRVIFFGLFASATFAVVAMTARLVVWPMWQHYRAVRAVTALLSQGDRNERLRAVEELVRLDPEAAVPALINAMKEDDNILVRSQAAYLLGELGPNAREAIPALIDALEDENWIMRGSSACALGQLGPMAKDAIPALTVLMNHDYGRVREDAVEALLRIDRGLASKAGAQIEVRGNHKGDGSRFDE